MEQLLISLGFVEDTTSSIALQMAKFGNKTYLLANNEDTSLHTYVYYPANYPRNKVVVITKISETSFGVYEEQMQFKVNLLEDLLTILKSII